jgi:5-methylcytosine-specific restriction protein A
VRACAHPSPHGDSAAGVAGAARGLHTEPMSTYLFAWNPALWNWPELARDRAKLARAGHVDIEWSSGRAKNLEPGSRAFLVRLGVPPKGLFGAGFVLTAPVSGAHWLEHKAKAGATTNYVRLRLESLEREPIVTFDDLAQPPFSRYRWAVRQSGTRVPSTLAERLEALWDARRAAQAPRTSARRKA